MGFMADKAGHRLRERAGKNLEFEIILPRNPGFFGMELKRKLSIKQAWESLSMN